MRTPSLCESVALLEQLYGEPRHGNVRDPYWELIYILLSIRTSEAVYRPVFQRVRRKYRSATRLSRARIDLLARDLKVLGLANLRARQLRDITRSILRDIGLAGLTRLGRSNTEAFERYLCSHRGVGPKIAKCVSMYAFGAASLPVDAHVWRVMSRLGLAAGGRLTATRALELEQRVPQELRYKVHILALAHGRKICKPVPLCESCVLSTTCPSSKRDQLRNSPRRAAIARASKGGTEFPIS